MKYGMIISLLCINGLFAQTPNDIQLKEYIAKNQSRFEQEIIAEKKAVEKEALYVLNGLGVMMRIVAAFNQKNVSDEEATKLAQQAFEKMQQIIASDSWKKAINPKTSGDEKFLVKNMIYGQINKFCEEQTAKDLAKKKEYRAQKALIQAFLDKFAESANA